MIHVLIERHIAEGMLSTYNQMLRSALQQTYVEHGFISGEEFHDITDEHCRYLICKWRTVQDWHRWSHSEARKKLIHVMQAIMEREEKVTLLTY